MERRLLNIFYLAFFASIYMNAQSLQDIKIGKCEPPKDYLEILNYPYPCNYDSAKIEIRGDTLAVIKMLLKKIDRLDLKYYALIDLVSNLNTVKQDYYLERYLAVRDSTY